MSYRRVVPRDLFNEAKLLKCLGALYIAAEHFDNETLHVEHANEGSRDGWDIQQDETDGSIFCANVSVMLRGAAVHCYTPLNSKRPYPLWASIGDELYEVFTDEGKLTGDFALLLQEP